MDIKEDEQCKRETVISDIKSNIAANHGPLNGRVLISKEDGALVGMEFDAVPQFCCDNEDTTVSFLVITIENVEKVPTFPIKVCSIQPAQMYKYEVMLYGSGNPK